MRKSLSAVLVAILVAAPVAPAQAAAKGAFGKNSAYKGVRIHMSLAKAKATGKLKNGKFSGPCMHTDFKKFRTPVGVVISRKYGVVGIGAPKTARTPRGIGIGSTVKQAKRAYPDFKAGFSYSYAKVPGSKTARYGFSTVKGRVTDMWLMARLQDCAS